MAFLYTKRVGRDTFADGGCVNFQDVPLDKELWSYIMGWVIIMIGLIFIWIHGRK